MSFGDKQIDPDDFFAETRMSFGEHLDDLRTHLWRAFKGFFVAVFISFFLGKQVLAFIAAPVEQQLGEFHARRVRQVAQSLRENDPTLKQKNLLTPQELFFPRDQLQEQLGIPLNPKTVMEVREDELADPTGEGLFGPGVAQGALGNRREYIVLTPSYRPLDQAIANSMAEKEVGRRPVLSTLNVQEAFVVFFKVCIVTGFVLASPWVFYQIWAFVAAGLYPHERRYVNVFLPFSLGLFLVGVLVCEFLVMPKAVEALLWFNEWLGLEPDLRLNEWLGFAVWMPVIFGLSFQTPLVMLFLERIGLMTVEAYSSKRRIAWFLMAIFAAVITPSTDAFSMLFLWVPMSMLYELGIWLCRFSPRKPELDVDVPESEAMVEV